MLALRKRNSDFIISAVNQSIEEGLPINRPMWFVDPDDPVTFTIDDRKQA
jgi:alpha-glucosidase (family GH31 glycosyl hydrolase)